MGAVAQQRSTWVAWSMLGIFAVEMGIGSTLGVTNVDGEFLNDPAGQLALLVAFSAFMIVGAVIVARRPRNSIGWIFSAIGLLEGTAVLAETYAEHAAATSTTTSWAVVAAWYNAWFWYPLISLAIVFTPLVFPTGRLLSPRWRPVAVVAVAAVAVMVAMSAVQPTLGDGGTIQNPVGVGGIADPEASVLGDVMFGLLTACAVAAALSLLLRFRRSHGVERQQLKWFAYAGALTACIVLLGDSLPDTGVLNVNVLFGVAIGLLPVSAGIAILRYRLYDIDRLIRRTVSYSLLTAVLGAVYAGVVVIAGQVFGGVGGHPPSWLIAAATLAVAGLFQPARRRIQAHVDRRFNRSRYDASQTVGVLAARLRNELDADTISAQLLAAVGRTMQPSTASLWLWTPAAARK
jgi:hypothetical protein